MGDICKHLYEYEYYKNKITLNISIANLKTNILLLS